MYESKINVTQVSFDLLLIPGGLTIEAIVEKMEKLSNEHAVCLGTGAENMTDQYNQQGCLPQELLDQYLSFIPYTDETVTLTTYKLYVEDEDELDENGDENSREFTVPTQWAREQVAKHYEQAKVFPGQLEEFLDSYIWDQTDGWPEQAKADGVLGDIIYTGELVVEHCPHCEYEVKLPVKLGIYKCPVCEKDLANCSMCDPESVDCDKCLATKEEA